MKRMVVQRIMSQTLTIILLVCTQYQFEHCRHLIIFLEPITAPPIEAYVDPAEPAPRLDDIRTEFHPRSGRAPLTESFEIYGRKAKKAKKTVQDTEPWSPFQTRADFELAEFALDACLNARQFNTILKLVQNNEVTFKNDHDLKTAWAHASNLLTPVCNYQIIHCNMR